MCRHLLLFICISLFCSCTINVPLDVNLGQSTSSELEEDYSVPVNVVIQVPNQLEFEVHSEGGLVMVGMAHTWEVKMGEALRESIGPFFENYFDQVIVSSAKNLVHASDQSGLLIYPIVDHVNVSKITLQTEVAINFHIVDSLGRLIYEYRASGDSPLVGGSRVALGLLSLTTPLVGDLLGKYVIANSVEEALMEAYTDLAVDLEYKIKQGIFEQTWLPKNILVKTEYGRYEFAAEKLARSKGCDLSTDGIRLVESEPNEIYECYCYGKPVFYIRCELGRCQSVQKAHQSVVSTTENDIPAVRNPSELLN